MPSLAFQSSHIVDHERQQGIRRPIVWLSFCYRRRGEHQTRVHNRYADFFPKMTFMTCQEIDEEIPFDDPPQNPPHTQASPSAWLLTKDSLCLVSSAAAPAGGLPGFKYWLQATTAAVASRQATTKHVTISKQRLRRPAAEYLRPVCNHKVGHPCQLWPACHTTQLPGCPSS